MASFAMAGVILAAGHHIYYASLHLTPSDGATSIGTHTVSHQVVTNFVGTLVAHQYQYQYHPTHIRLEAGDTYMGICRTGNYVGVCCTGIQDAVGGAKPACRRESLWEV
jgi:hypothetical protein